LLPVVTVGFLGVLVAIIVQVVRSAAGLPDPRILGITALDLVAYSVAGFAAGLLLPFAVAGPLALAATFIWLGFVPAIYPVWLRHLTGMFRDCCGLGQDLAVRPLVASTIVDLAIVGAAALLVAGPRLILYRVGSAVALLTAAAAAGVLLVAGLTYAPVVPRDIALLECRTKGEITLCAWPEHEAHAAELLGIASNTWTGWQHASIHAPTIFSEADPTVAPVGALVFAFSGSYTKDDFVEALAFGLLPAFPDCPGGATGGIAFMDLEAWYSATGGMTAGGLRARYGDIGLPGFPAPLTVVDELTAASADVRRAWVSRAEHVSQACEDWAPDLIDVHP
jgi:hypothetical protein